MPQAGEVRDSSTKLGGPYAWFVVVVLSLATIVSYIDRQIINLLVEPIKADLNIGDTQISLLQGFSFALFYALLAVPVARIADSSNRTLVISVGIVFWSVATFSCGLATTYAALFLARMFVGVGEATLTPAGYSMIGDYFPKERVGLAISLFVGSSFVGSGLAYIFGGYLINELNLMGSMTFPVVGELQPWQLTFIVVSLPAIALLALMYFVKEPIRRESIRKSGHEDASFRTVIAYLRSNANMFAGIFFGLTTMAAASFALGAWTPSYFIRVHEWSPIQTGTALGFMVMIASAGGVFTGGWLSSQLMQRGYLSSNLLVPAIGGTIAIPFVILFPLIPNPTLSLVVLAPAFFFSAMPFGCGTAVIPLIAPNRIRAQIMAIYLLLANLLGFTLGPTSVAILTDSFFQDPLLIGYSLSIAPSVLLGLGALFVALAIPGYAKVAEEFV